ncbi:hypothetical protein EON65_27195 [archaeon]|nr:MAG: hypothetical protein EON65_27195 [archaeon]
MDEETDKGLKTIHRIVCGFLSRPECFAFREPVDWKGLELWDYPKIVKIPMDLGTIKSKIEKREYTTVEEAAEDMRLIWKNCMLYNSSGSELYHIADKFSRAFEDAYKAVRKLGDSQLDMERVPNVDEKIQLSHDIFKIGNADLAYVMTIIEDACPYAMSRTSSADEVLINFDALTPKCFHTVTEYVMNAIINSTGGKKTNNKKRKSEGGDK